MVPTVFADGRDAPLYKTIVEDEELAPSVSAFQMSRELTGEFRIRIRAFPTTSLADLEAAVGRAFDRFEEERFTADDLDRIKAQIETGFYNGIVQRITITITSPDERVSRTLQVVRGDV